MAYIIYYKIANIFLIWHYVKELLAVYIQVHHLELNSKFEYSTSVQAVQCKLWLFHMINTIWQNVKTMQKKDVWISLLQKEKNSTSFNPVNHICFFFIDHSVVSQRSTSCWCLVTYFEQSLKVGDIWKASSPSITIDGFTDTGDPQRFCLGPLYNIDRTQSAEIARRNIGKKKTQTPYYLILSFTNF